MLRRIVLSLALVVAMLPPAQAQAPAQEQDGCQKFAWPLARERTLFGAATVTPANDGDTLGALPQGAIAVRLSRGGDAKFFQPPERKPRDANGFGGAIRLPALSKAGLYQITTSDEAWIDAIQDEQYLRSAGSTGRRDCAGLRKSVRINLGAKPLVLQFSGVETDTIKVAITPVE